MERLRAAYRTAVTIGLAVMASLVLYLIIVGLIEGGSITLSEGALLAGGSYGTVQFLLLGVSVLLFFAVPGLNRIMLSSSRGPGARGGAGIGRLTNAAVVTYALCEVPAIFGLVLYVLGRRITDFFLFLLISFFFFASFFPRYRQWEEWYRKQER